MRANSAWNAPIAEALGTFLFFFVGIGAGYVATAQIGAGSLVTVALAHGIVLAVLVSAFGPISGGHFNPAVTFGLWLASRIDTVRAATYVIAQLIGAVLAALLVSAFVPAVSMAEGGLPALGGGVDAVNGTLIEAGLTMVLAAAVFGTAIDPRGPRIGGLAIGLAVAAGIMFGGPLTGGALNPARWFGPAVVAGDFSGVFVYIVGPLLGAGLIAVLYRFLFLPEAEMQGAPEPTEDVRI
jgi:MIP family channel proteins